METQMKRKAPKSTLLSMIAAAGLVALAPSVSEAGYQPQLHHSGSMCQVHSGTPGYYNVGTISNNSWSTDLVLMCPVVRENRESNIGRVSVHLRDASHSDGIRCRFYDSESYGRSVRWSSWKTTLGGGDGNIGTLSWNMGTALNRHSGYTHLRCTVPPRTSDGYSYIASYRAGGRP